MILDWQSIEDRLFDESKALIRRFAVEHPDVTCSFFAYDVNPAYGEIFPSFDSYENMLQKAKEEEQSLILSQNMTPWRVTSMETFALSYGKWLSD